MFVFIDVLFNSIIDLDYWIHTNVLKSVLSFLYTLFIHYTPFRALPPTSAVGGDFFFFFFDCSKMAINHTRHLQWIFAPVHDACRDCETWARFPDIIEDDISDYSKDKNLSLSMICLDCFILTHCVCVCVTDIENERVWLYNISI